MIHTISLCFSLCRQVNNGPMCASVSKFDSEKDARLVELYRESRDALESIGNSSCVNKRRRQAWHSVANTLNRENRTSFTSDQCKIKIKNFRNTFLIRISS